MICKMMQFKVRRIEVILSACSSLKVGLKGKVSILLGFILLASFIFVLNLSTLNFMYSPSDHLGKLGRLKTLLFVSESIPDTHVPTIS